MLSLICSVKTWDYYHYFLAFGFSGTYWAGLEIEIDYSAAPLAASDDKLASGAFEIN
jgi:hypothetical protein